MEARAECEALSSMCQGGDVEVKLLVCGDVGHGGGGVVRDRDTETDIVCVTDRDLKMRCGVWAVGEWEKGCSVGVRRSGCRGRSIEHS